MNEFTFLADTLGRLVRICWVWRWGLARTPCSPLYRSHGSPDRDLAALMVSAGPP